MRKPKPKFKIGHTVYSANGCKYVVVKMHLSRWGGTPCECCGAYEPVAYAWFYNSSETSGLYEGSLRLKPWPGVAYR